MRSGVVGRCVAPQRRALRVQALLPASRMAVHREVVDTATLIAMVTRSLIHCWACFTRMVVERASQWQPQRRACQRSYEVHDFRL